MMYLSKNTPISYKTKPTFPRVGQRKISKLNSYVDLNLPTSEIVTNPSGVYPFYPKSIKYLFVKPHRTELNT